MDLKTVLILLASVCNTVSLECNTCKDVKDVALCNTTQLCQHGQACIHNLTTTSQGQLMNLGCVDYQQCGVHGNIPNTIVGRDIHERQTSDCLECCSTDQCNRVLCEHLLPTTCVDDESIDCAKMNTLFSICSDVDHAKKVCPKFCGLCNVVDGNWLEWSSWSQCDVTCENGTQIRSRSCTNPSPQHGGSNCAGNSIEGKPCHRDLCPVHGGWSGWEEWGSCSVTCDMGLQRRTRNCSNPVPIRNGNPCFGHNLDVMQCMPGPCANGGWSDWSDWSTCSVTCGGGIQTKTRSCTNPRPSPFGKDCIGKSMDVESCAMSGCEQNHCKSNPCVNGHCYEVVSDYICMCNHGFEGKDCDIFASDCYDIKHLNMGQTTAVYGIHLWKSHKPLNVLCDMDTAGGGWTVFQNRYDGSVDFYRNFANYTAGFGSMNGEFWLGLESLRELVSQGKSELRIDVTTADGISLHGTFANFNISAGPYYTLHVSPETGTLGSGISSSNNNMHFSTFDHDKDTNSGNCAEMYHGAWWYYSCRGTDLNGIYFSPGTFNYTSMSIYGPNNGMAYQSLKTSKMMFRRV
ncbi:neurogenic locus notch homolog protein 1-like [Mercenaria mercenaria]|uniref:neurogenic locus notch homolog protein 1-like n=1 Tax=Mercenaria mercenaria TaxID=6596 RepID=UPI00234F1D24|nr:neurogenic locus notch homolog protein 1-like [Mercenaria mercenaria]